MGTVYKETYTKPMPADAEIITRKGERLARWKDRNGKRRTASVTTGRDGSPRILVTAGTYSAKYRDGSGHVQKTATGCRDETAARRVLGDLERRAELVKAKVMTAAESNASEHQRTPLGLHFKAYLSHQETASVSPARINDTRSQLARIADECGFRKLRDLDSTAFERWLNDRKSEGMAAGTRNRYRESLVGFANWCVRAGRLLINPVADVPKADQKAEATRQRRALTEDELRSLLDAARRRPLVDAMTVRRGKDKGKQKAKLRPETRRRLERIGRERALIYKTYLLTGLRKCELASLDVGQLELDGPLPYAALNAADEKSRQGNEIALRSDLAEDLRCWLGEKLNALQAESRNRGEPLPLRLPADMPVFDVPTGLLRILDRDLAFAGIPKKDERGRTVDIHALRHTFGTHLSRAGVAPRTAQAAMRHSKIDLTMNVYTDPKLLDVHGAIESLPSLSLDGTTTETETATGTDGQAERVDRTLVPVLVPNADNSCLSGQFSTTGTPDAVDGAELKKCKKPLEKACFPGVSVASGSVGGIGFEPTTSTMSTWRSSQLS